MVHIAGDSGLLQGAARHQEHGYGKGKKRA